jgi:Predicted membrane protein
MDLQKFIRIVQSAAVLIIFLGAAIGFGTEILVMFNKGSIQLADLLLLFIYVEVMGMVRVYLLSEEIRITYPLIISITAISRLIILQKKDLDPSILVYESIAILIIAAAIIVLRLRYLRVLKPKKDQK